jgi:hypothetical protein
MMTDAERREKKPLALGALAQGARDRAKTPRKTAVACGRYQPLEHGTGDASRPVSGWTLHGNAAHDAVLDRLDWQLAELRNDLATAARCQVITAAIIGELTVIR